MKLLIKNGHVIRWNGARVEQLPGHHILIEDNRIVSVSPTPADADETIDATGCAVIPGLIGNPAAISSSSLLT